MKIITISLKTVGENSLIGSILTSPSPLDKEALYIIVTPLNYRIEASNQAESLGLTFMVIAPDSPISTSIKDLQQAISKMTFPVRPLTR